MERREISRPLPRGSVPRACEINWAGLEAFDFAGRSARLLALGRYAAGSYELPWDLRGADGVCLTNGVYFMRLRTDDGSRLSRVVVVQ